jgi:hypothetical protein
MLFGSFTSFSFSFAFLQPYISLPEYKLGTVTGKVPVPPGPTLRSSNKKTNDFASLSDQCLAFTDPERDITITPKV